MELHFLRAFLEAGPSIEGGSFFTGPDDQQLEVSMPPPLHHFIKEGYTNPLISEVPEGIDIAHVPKGSVVVPVWPRDFGHLINPDVGHKPAIYFSNKDGPSVA